MKQILIATHNPSKLKDLKTALLPLTKESIKIISLNDLQIKEEPDEPGATFKENSLIKARYYALKTGLPTIADDAGLLIDILNGEPGVKSRRWLGRDATDQELINYTLYKLEGVPLEKRTARLKLCLCYYNPHTKTTLFKEEETTGYVPFKSSNKPSNGYPFRAVFIVSKFNKYYDDLTDQEHDELNHRIKAGRNLLDLIRADLLK